MIPAGMVLRATVDVYMDPTQPFLMTGIRGFSNTHTNELGFFGGRGDGYILGDHGTDNSAILTGYISNPTHAGWHNFGIEIEQISPTMLRSTYLLDGFVFKHNGFTTTTHDDTVGGFVSDISLVSINHNGSTADAMTAVYDNYKIEIVPEPLTLLVLAGGLAALLRRRRR